MPRYARNDWVKLLLQSLVAVNRLGGDDVLYLSYYDSPVGSLGIVENGAGVTNIYLTAKKKPKGHFQQHDTPLLQTVIKQLQEYFSGHRKEFDFPMNPSGTPFQRQVWSALCTIPYGDTWSYKDVAQKVDHPRAYRAVGGANNKNPLIIVIPCHRVIGTDGSLTGYGGGLEVKAWLLEFERNNCSR